MPKAQTTVDKRSRKHSLVTYLMETDLVNCLNAHKSSIRGFEYIYHDKDVTEDGSPKELHAHINLLLFDAKTSSVVRRWFTGNDIKGCPANTLAQICIDVYAMHDYLTHKENPDKYQYSPEDIVSSDPSLFEGTADQSEDVACLALNDMLEGVPLQDIAKRYGRDFIYHYGHIKQVYADIIGGSNGAN